MHDVNVRSIAAIAGAFMIAIFGLTVIFGSWYTVDAGERVVLLRFGNVIGVSGPGLHFKWPWIEDINRIDVRTTYFAWEGKSTIETYSKDQQPASMSVKVTYRVKPDDASVTQLYSEYKTQENVRESVLIPRTYEALKTVFGQFNAVTAIQERTVLNQQVEAAVRKAIDAPVIIQGVQIQDISYSTAYENAVEEQMKALVEVQKITNNLEREKKQAEIVVVKARAEEERLSAIGRGQAAAINLRGKALRDNPELVALTIAEKWNGTLPTTMVPGESVPLVNIK